MPDPTPEDRREALEIVRILASPNGLISQWSVEELKVAIATALVQRTEKVRQEEHSGQVATVAMLDCGHEKQKLLLPCAKCYQYLLATLAEKEAELTAFEQDLKVAEDEAIRLTVEAGRLRKALKDYGNHVGRCYKINDATCICGYDKALSSPPAEAGCGSIGS